MTTTLEERARELRNRIAGEFHLSGQCGSDGGTFDEVLKSGYECCCYEAADLMLPILAQLQAEPREQLAAWMIEHSFATGHGDTFEDLLKELSWQVKELRQPVAEARLSEQAEHTPECWHFNNVSAKEWIDEYFKLRDKRIAELRALAQAAAPATKEG